MAVFGHKYNSKTKKKFIVSNEVSLDESTTLIIFDYFVDADNNENMNAKKIKKPDYLDLSDWEFTRKFPAAHSIYSRYANGLLSWDDE